MIRLPFLFTLLKTWFNNGSGAWILTIFIVAALVAGVIRWIRVEHTAGAGSPWADKRVWFYFGIALAIYLFTQFIIIPDYR